MTQAMRKPVIDFTSYIVERADHFTGREWLFQDINAWLADPQGERFFLVKGEPGSGKTAISARLSQFAEDTVSPPDGLAHLTSNFLSALHFCSARDSRWIHPRVFAESLAMQLAERYPAYAKALAEKSGDRSIRIEVEQHIEQGDAVGVIINKLDVGGTSPEDAFNRVVREPLEALVAEELDRQVIILVDALDEALSSSLEPNIVTLLSQTDNLSSHVRFILTTRQESRVENKFRNMRCLSISTPNDQRNQVDIGRYVQDRLDVDLALIEKAEQAETEQIAELVEIVPRKAEGNFLYARFLLDAMAKGLRPLTELSGLPTGLDELYFDSLNRVFMLGKRDWLTMYLPLMGVLSVAQESLTIAQLQAFTAQQKSSVRQYLSDFQQFIQETSPRDDQSEQEARYRLYHQSFIDFLGRKRIFRDQRQLTNDYYIPPDEWHRRIVDHIRGRATSWENVDWSQGDAYGLRYLAQHLFSIEEDQQLVNLLKGPFLIAKVQYLGSYRSILDDLRLGMQVAVQLKNFSVLLYFALVYVGLKQRLGSLPVQDLIPLYAAMGQVDRAVEMARLLDTKWIRGTTMRAMVDILIPVDLAKSLEVAKQIDYEGYRTEALTRILRNILKAEQSLIGHEPLVASIEELIEHDNDSLWKSNHSWQLAEILQPFDQSKTAKLIEQAEMFARKITYDAQARFEVFRWIAEIASKLDSAWGIRLYLEAISALEEMHEGDWKGEEMGKTFGDLALLNADLAIRQANKIRSVVGKPFAFANLAARFGRTDQKQAASLVEQSLHAARDISFVGKTEAEDWEDQANAAAAWAMARYDLKAALALLDNIHQSRHRDVAYSQIVHDLAGDISLALDTALRIEKLDTRSQALAFLASSQFERDVDLSLGIITNYIPVEVEKCRALIDIGTRLLDGEDARGVQVVDQAIGLASSQAGMEASLLAEIASRLRPHNRRRSEELGERAVEKIMAGGNRDQRINVLLQVARLYIQENKTTSAFSLMQKVAQISRGNVYEQDWLIESLSVLFEELARHDLESALTLFGTLPVLAQAFMRFAIIEALAETDLEQSLHLATHVPNELIETMKKRDFDRVRRKALASTILAAAHQGSSQTLSLAELLWNLDGGSELTDTSDTLAQASTALAQYDLNSARHLLNKILAHFSLDRTFVGNECLMHHIGQALVSIAKCDREAALELIPEVVLARKRANAYDEGEHLAAFCEEIASFAPDKALTILDTIKVEPARRSKALSSVALALANSDRSQAIEILNTAIQEANKSTWQMLPVEALLVAASRAMTWDHSRMQILVDQAITLARDAHKKYLGELLAQAAKLFLIAGQVDQAVPLLSEAIESMRYDHNDTQRGDILEEITKALDVCSEDMLLQLLPQILYATLDAANDRDYFLFKGMPLILPFFWRVSKTDVVETIHSLIYEIEAAAQVMQEIYMG